MKKYCWPWLLCCGALFAAPSGFVCKAGDATHEPSIVRSSGRAVVHWDSFSLAPHETFRFEQSGSNSAILNRVVGSSVSEIHGTISSNGAVWLVNPNGIVIGPQGRVNAASFLASTLDLLDNDFLSKETFLFSGNQEGHIVQQGVIECSDGYVMLMSSSKIMQEGTIEAAKVGLGAGTEILFSPKDSPLMAIRLETLDEVDGSANYFAKAIQHKGLIEAKQFEERGGEVYLVAANGMCELTDAKIMASRVHLLGEKVGLLGRTVVDVSGEEGGGTVLIGGDYRGGNPDVPNAKMTFIDKGVLLKADAVMRGDGGKVVVWSDEATFYHGLIDIRGGPEGGNGGIAETSGHYLDFQGSARGEAPKGKAGTILLDPTTITISGTGAPSGGSFAAGVWTSSANTATIGATVNANSVSVLLGTTNVTINATAGGFAGTGAITISNAISWSTANTLTLVGRNIAINANVTSTNNTSTFTAINFTATGVAAADFVGILIPAGISVTTQSGNVVMSGTGGNGTNNHGISVIGAGANLTTGSGSIQLTGIASGTSGRGVHILTSGIVQSGSGAITLHGTSSGGGTTPNGIRLEVSNAVRSTTGNITLTGISTSATGISFTGAGVTSYATTGGIITFLGCQGNDRGLVVGVTTPGSIVFENCQGGAISNGHAVDFATTPCSAGGSITFINCQGGSGVPSHGVSQTASVVAGGNITATGCVGGTGSGSFGWNGTASLTSSAGSISIEASTTAGGATASHGINRSAGVISTGSMGTIVLNGTTSSSNTGASNGVNISGTGTISSGGGAVSITGTAVMTNGNSSNGVLLASTNPITSTGNAPISITGTSSATGTSCHGVSITPTWSTSSSGLLEVTGTGGSDPSSFDINLANNLTSAGSIMFHSPLRIAGATRTITGTGAITFASTVNPVTTEGLIVNGHEILFGGAWGDAIRLGNVTLQASSPTAALTINVPVTASAFTATVFRNIVVSAAIDCNGVGGIDLRNLGGSVANYHGISMSSATDSLTTANGPIRLSGIGGTSSGNRGVSIVGGAIVESNGGTITFHNCLGGTSGTNCAGVWIAGDATVVDAGAGDLIFSNVSGRGTAAAGSGIQVGTTGNPIVTVGGARIIGTNISGGAGTSTNYGFWLNAGVLGSASTTSIDITAVGGGTTTQNDGIRLTGGTIQTATMGTVTLNGTGGGTGPDSSNAGVRTITTATTFNNVDKLTLTGQGGVGTSSNFGVSIGAAPNFTGTTPSEVNFVNCIGGNGTDSTNVGVQIGTNFSVPTGTIKFLNIKGGTGTTTNYGVIISSTLAAPTILGTDIFGGEGTNNNLGFFLSGGTLGSASTTSIDITAVGGGTASTNDGIRLGGGIIQTATMGTVTLNGTGSGTGSGSGNAGVRAFNSTTFNNVDKLTLTGKGGTGTTSNYGVSIEATLNFTGTTPSEVNFINCIGGNGTGSTNAGVTIQANFSVPTGMIKFSNIKGGTGMNGCSGIRIQPAGVLSAPIILGTDIFGGDGMSTNHGFFLNGGTLGGASTTSISIAASGGGTTDTNCGVMLSTGTINADGPIILNGFGSSAATGDGNVGIAVRGVTFGSDISSLTLIGTGGGVSGSVNNHGVSFDTAAATYSSALSSFTIQGVGGAGSGGGHRGVFVQQPINLSTGTTELVFQHSIGSIGAAGVEIGASVTATGGSCTFTNCMGGSSGASNHGVFLSGGTLNTATIFGSALTGGAGTDTNNGFNLGGGNLGGGATTSISIAASSLGTGANNHGVALSSGTIQSSGAVSFTGSGSTAATGDGSTGVVLDGATFTAVPTLYLTGTGGSGGSGTRGIDIGANGTPSFPAALTTLRLIGHGGSGTSDTDGVRISTNPLSASNAALTLLNCTGGNTGRGVLVSSAVTASDIIFTNCSGGAGDASNNGVEVGSGGALNAVTITGTGMAGGTGMSGSGFAVVGGNVGNGDTTAIHLIGFSNGSSSTHCGILLAAGNMQGDAVTLQGTGSLLASGSNNTGILSSSFSTLSGTTIIGTGIGGSGSTGNRGIGWEAGAVEATTCQLTGYGGGTGGANTGVHLLAGSIELDGSALTVTGYGGGILTGGGSDNYGIALSGTSYTGISAFTFTGAGGRGTNNHYGVVVNAGSTVTLSSATTFLNCTGGFGGVDNAGVAFAQSLTLSSGALTFQNCSGDYGVWLQSGRTLTAPTCIGTGVNGHFGVFVNGGNIDCAGNLNLQTASVTGSNGAGVRIDNTGDVLVGGNAILMGMGSPQSANNNSYGLWITGALGAVGDVTLVGTAGVGLNSVGIVLESGGSVEGDDIALTGTTRLGLSTITSTTGSINLNGTVLLTADSPTLTTSGSIVFHNTVDGPFTLIANNANLLHFSQPVGSLAPLANLVLNVDHLQIDNNVTVNGTNPLIITAPTTIGGISTIETNGADMTWNTIDGIDLVLSPSGGVIHLTEDISLNEMVADGAVELEDDLTIIAAESLLFTDTVDGAHDLILTAHDITFNAPVGSSTPLTALTQTAGTGTTLFNSLHITNDIDLTGTHFTFNGAVSTDSGSVTLNNLGLATINAPFTLAGEFTQTGTGSTTLNGNISADGITFTGLVRVLGTRTLHADTSSNAPDQIEFLSAVDGPGGLILLADTLTFHAPVGGSIPLSSIQATAGQVSIGGNQTATGAISYTAPLTLTTDATLNGSTISVTGAVMTNGAFLTTQSTGNTTFMSPITTNGGNVQIESSGGSIFVSAINTSSMTSGGSIWLQPSTALTPGPQGNIPVGTITLAGSLNASGAAGGVISLAPHPRSAYPSIATIFTPPSTNITIQADTLTIGKNEAMTVLGNLALNIATITSLGDLVVLDNLDIHTPAFISHQRGPIPILNSSGQLIESQNSHIVYRLQAVTEITYPIANFLQQPTLTLSDLQYIPNSYTLNFDEGSPVPPVPPTPIIPVVVHDTSVDRLLIALSEMSDRLPLFWPKKYSLSICLQDDEDPCFYQEPSFVSFLPENQVK